MVLPIRTVVRPAVLAGQSNGLLPASILVDTPGVAGGPLVRLVTPAARAWRALTAAGERAGHDLMATSVVDSYRPYAVQENVFRQRYTTAYIPGVEAKVWLGTTWYKRSGYASAAVPGTSNHGWGLAVDVAHASGVLLDWLVAHAPAYGWSWELQSEPWHIRYCTGDAIPAAVLTYEENDVVTPEDIEAIAKRTKTLILSDGGVQRLLLRVEALLSGRDPVAIGDGEPNVLHRRLDAIDLKMPTGGGGSVDVEAVVESVLQRTRLTVDDNN